MTYNPGASFQVNESNVAPTVNNDSSEGYAVGSRWYDTFNDEEWVCLDNSVGAAVWENTTTDGGGGGLGGSIADQQVAFGNPSGDIDGTNNFVYDDTTGVLTMCVDGNTLAHILEQYATSGVPCIELRTARGTKASPGNIINGDELGELAFRGRAAGVFKEFAQVLGRADDITAVDGSVILRVKVANSFEDRIIATKSGAIVERLGVSGPLLHVCGDNGTDDGAKVRITSEPSVGTFRGGYIKYKAGANEFIVGVHDPDDMIEANDLEVIRLHRSPLGLLSLKALASEPSDGDLNNGEIAAYLDETLDLVGVKVKDSGGTAYERFVGEIDYVASETESTTTSSTFQTKLAHTTPTLPIGTYAFEWYSEAQSESGRMEARTTIDGTVEGIVDPDSSVEFVTHTGFKQLTFGSAATHTIAIEYRHTSGGNTARIRRARIRYRRIS